MTVELVEGATSRHHFVQQSGPASRRTTDDVDLLIHGERVPVVFDIVTRALLVGTIRNVTS